MKKKILLEKIMMSGSISRRFSTRMEIITNVLRYMKEVMKLKDMQWPICTGWEEF